MSSVPQCHGEEEGLLLRNNEEELLVSSYTLRARVMDGGLLLGLIAFVLWALVPPGESAATSSGQSLYAMSGAGFGGWKDTDMAKYRSGEVIKINKSYAEAEEAWRTPGEESGIHWRIEKFEVMPWPKAKFGKFCDGHSYIVLNTHEEGGERHYDLHYLDQ